MATRLDETQMRELDHAMPHSGCLIYLPYVSPEDIIVGRPNEALGFFGRVKNFALPNRAIIGGFTIEITPHQSFFNGEYCWGKLEYHFDKKSYTFEQVGVDREIAKCLMGLDPIERLAMRNPNAAFNNLIRQLYKKV